VDDTDPFAVPGVQWTRLGPGLLQLRRSLLGATVLAVTVVSAVVAVLAESARIEALLIAGVALVVLVPAWVGLARSHRAWGYAERDDDLVVTRGVLWRRIDLVPYGRLQMVDVTSGPLERLFGIATVRVHTASPSTRAHIPGLVPHEASRLRDRLTRRGEVQAIGL
jgi:membrane protein YdbS with pleckstrin-like domain